MLNIKLSKQAGRFLEKIPAKHAAQIVDKLDKLAADPASVPSVQLEGFPLYRRAKSGEYRIIYRIEDGAIKLLVVLIGKRNDSDIYREMVRILGA